MNMTLVDMIEGYERLSRHNDLALEMLTDCRGVPEALALDDLEGHLSSMAAIIVQDLFVAESPYAYSFKAAEYGTRLLRKMNEIFLGLRRSIESARISCMARSGISPNVGMRLMDTRRDLIMGLNPKLAGSFSPVEVGIDDLRTPHDYLRFLHAVATEMLFDPGRDWGDAIAKGDNAYAFSSGGLEMHLLTIGGVRAEELARRDPFLARFHEIAESDRFTSKGRYCDAFHIFGRQDMLSIQMPLGCHYATFRIRSIGRGYDLQFSFVDTITYKNSRFRTDCTDLILRCLGHYVDRKENVLHVHTAYDSVDDSVNAFEALLRLSVSLFDLDMTDPEHTQGQEREVVDAFFHGVLNLAAYVCYGLSEGFVKYAKSRGSYRLVVPADVYQRRLNALMHVRMAERDHEER